MRIWVGIKIKKNNQNNMQKLRFDKKTLLQQCKNLNILIQMIKKNPLSGTTCLM